MTPADIAARVRSTAELRAGGYTRVALERALREKRVIRIHRGWHVDAGTWNGFFAEQRQLARVFAVDASMREGDAVFSHTSAAALWELPFARFEPKRVHLVSERMDGRTSGDPLLARHRAVVPDHEVTRRHGVLCTTLERTVADVIGALPLEAGVAIADAAMRRIAWNSETRRYDESAAEQWRQEMRARLDACRGRRHVIRARWVIGFADGRAQLPGESISRLYLHWLGFESPRLQVVVIGPDGEEWAIDFGLDDIPAWGEFDGESKYTDEELRAGRTPSQVVVAEKWREDWIRGSTRRPFLRWGNAHIASADALGRRFAAFAVTQPTPRLRSMR